MIFIAVLAIIGIAALFLIRIYNQLVRARNEIHNAFSQIDVQLHRRHDLIPNLVAVAQKYLQHEEQTLTRVISARTAAVNALKSTQIEQIAPAEKALEQAMKGFYACIESYPELKANEQMQTLQEEISSTENRIAFARQYFNEMVTIYNASVEQFPQNIISQLFGFRTQSWYEIEESVRACPTVSFDKTL